MKDSRHNQALPKKVGLALGSGSSRGWAHIGVIHALHEAGIEVGWVAGTSIGSLVGAALALGRLDGLENFTRQLDWKQVLSYLDISLSKTGLIDGDKISDYFRGHIDKVNIEDLAVPFRAVATDLNSGRQVVMGEGDLVAAVRASISVPGVFTLVSRDGRYLVDGGLVNPVPVSVVRDMGADFIIAVDLNHDLVGDKRRAGQPSSSESDPPHLVRAKSGKGLADKLDGLGTPGLNPLRRWLQRDPAPNIFEVLINSINIMSSRITAARLAADPPDLLIQPHLGHIRFLEFHRADEAIEEGHRVAARQLARWKDSLGGRQRP